MMELETEWLGRSVIIKAICKGKVIHITAQYKNGERVLRLPFPAEAEMCRDIDNISLHKKHLTTYTKEYYLTETLPWRAIVHTNKPLTQKQAERFAKAFVALIPEV